MSTETAHIVPLTEDETLRLRTAQSLIYDVERSIHARFNAEVGTWSGPDAPSERIYDQRRMARLLECAVMLDHILHTDSL